jgi:hypothetical protein
LEPGDPGFVPYSNPQTKPKRMKLQRWYPVRTAEQIIWLENFVAKLAGHAAALGISTTDCAAAIADARWLIYVLGSWLPAVRAWKESCTEAAEAAESGTGGVQTLPAFTAPPLPGAAGALPAVVPVAEGALARIFALVNDVKDDAASTIAEDLRLVGPEETGPNFDTLAPKIAAKNTATGIEIGWGWQGFGKFLDQCEIEVDRGTGWTLLTIDTTPNYKDTATPPATLTRWKYRAIYRIDDARVGQWSTEAEVTVGG